MEYCTGIVVVLAMLEEVLAGERGLVREQSNVNGPDGRIQSGRRGGIRLTGVLGGHGELKVGEATPCAGESQWRLKCR